MDEGDKEPIGHKQILFRNNKMKMTAKDIELAVCELLNYRVNSIVPNVSHGLIYNHECDLLMLDEQQRFTEIEIKVSKSDLIADFKKSHGHRSKIISRLIYAVSDTLKEAALELIPKQYGIIIVEERGEDFKYYRAVWIRRCRHNENRPTQENIKTFNRLGLIRIWNLKREIKYLKKQIKLNQPC